MPPSKPEKPELSDAPSIYPDEGLANTADYTNQQEDSAIGDEALNAKTNFNKIPIYFLVLSLITVTAIISAPTSAVAAGYLVVLFPLIILMPPVMVVFNLSMLLRQKSRSLLSVRGKWITIINLLINANICIVFFYSIDRMKVL